MAENELMQLFLAKAQESLDGAESELVNGRYNNTANRCYYGCFQAAIAALLQAGIRPSGPQWSHEFVQAQFVGQLINRRHLYPTELRAVLTNTQGLRNTADYAGDQVNRREADRALRWSRPFVAAVQEGGERR